MIIKYNGTKEVKKLIWQTKDWGIMEFVFNPMCKVTDPEFAKFLLHPERQGLFSIVEEPKEKVHEAVKPEEPMKVQLEDQKPVKKIRSKKNLKKLGDADGTISG